MIESTHGIITRTRPLSETSLIVHWITPDLGRLATVAKGARRAGSPFTGKIDLFYSADFSFNRSRHSELHVLREVSLRETLPAIREDIGKLQQAGYAVAFLEQATESETPMPEIYATIRGFLDQLAQRKLTPADIFALEFKLLTELGLAPDIAETPLSAGSKKVAESLLQPATAARIKLSDQQVVELGGFLNRFLAMHLGRVPRGRATAIAAAETD
jgi:DNA repair protein RecO (recombination protein O)